MAVLLAEAVRAPGRGRRTLAAVPTKLVVGGAIVAAAAALVITGPWIAPYPFDGMRLLSRLKPPDAAHWFGTDEFGRDVLSRVLFGARLSIAMGLCATILSLTLGVFLGLMAGYRRGRTDEFIMRVMDLMMSIPPIMLGLLILAVTTPALWKAVLAVGLVYVPPIVRTVRSVAIDLGQEEFIQAARARAERTSFILARELLPNAMPVIAVEGSLRVTFAILLGAALSVCPETP